MVEQEAIKTTLSPQQLEQLWAEHLKGEFETKDVESTLATMVDDAYVNHMPVNTGGRGKEALRIFLELADNVSIFRLEFLRFENLTVPRAIEG